MGYWMSPPVQWDYLMANYGQIVINVIMDWILI